MNPLLSVRSVSKRFRGLLAVDHKDGVRLVGKTAITHSILMRARSRTVRYIRAVHDLEKKTIHLRSVQREANI